MLKVAIIMDAFDLAGAEKSAFYIAKCLDRGKFTPIMIAVGRGGKLENEFRKYGIQYHIINTGRLLSIKGCFKLFGLLKTLNIDIIHSHTFTAHIQSRIVVRFLKNIVIISSYQNQSNWMKSSRLRDKGKKLIDRVTGKYLSDALLYVSEGTKTFFERHGYRNNNTAVIYNSIESDQIGKIDFSKRLIHDEFHIQPNEKVIVCIGRLTEQKGYEYLFPAFKAVLSKIHNIKIIIFGEDQKSEFYTELLINNNIQDNVIITDEYPYIYEILSQADLFVSASLWEGLPRAHLEALLCGCPVVSTDIGGSNEIIVDSYNGILVKPKNSQELTEAILKILNNREVSNGFKKYGFRVLKDKFDIGINTAKLEKIYLSLWEDNFRHSV